MSNLTPEFVEARFKSYLSQHKAKSYAEYMSRIEVKLPVSLVPPPAQPDFSVADILRAFYEAGFEAGGDGAKVCLGNMIVDNLKSRGE